MKPKNPPIIFFIIILSIFIICPSFFTFAQECHTFVTESLPGNREEIHACECTGSQPEIKVSSETIASNSDISLWVDSGGLACPDYEWSVSGTGYSLDDSTTKNDLETVTLSCAAGSCGVDYDVYCTVTVTDQCGETVNVVIRNTGGTWQDFTYLCGPSGSVEGGIQYWIIGKYRYSAKRTLDGLIYVTGTCQGGSPVNACTQLWYDLGGEEAGTFSGGKMCQQSNGATPYPCRLCTGLLTNPCPPTSTVVWGSDVHYVAREEWGCP